MPNNKENESKRIGDTLFTAESHVVVAEATSTHYREVIEGRTQADIPDLLRHLNGSFWCLNEDSIQQLFKNRFTTDGSQINATLLATRTSASTGSGLQPGETAQDFRISFNGENEEADWKEALKSWRDDSSRENIVFEDHTTTIDMYEEGSNLQEESAGVKNHFAEIKSDYNFLETRYEKVLGELLPEEKALPNFYGFVLKNQNSDSWKNLIRLGDRIQVPESERLDNEQSNFKPVSRYYNAWAKNFGDYVEDPDYTENIEKTKVIRFTKTEMESLSDLYKYLLFCL